MAVGVSCLVLVFGWVEFLVNGNGLEFGCRLVWVVGLLVVIGVGVVIVYGLF